MGAPAHGVAGGLIEHEAGEWASRQHADGGDAEREHHTERTRIGQQLDIEGCRQQAAADRDEAEQREAGAL